MRGAHDTFFNFTYHDEKSAIYRKNFELIFFDLPFFLLQVYSGEISIIVTVIFLTAFRNLNFNYDHPVYHNA